MLNSTLTRRPVEDTEHFYRALRSGWNVLP